MLKVMQEPCPRCEMQLSTHPALSRADDRTAVCSICGVDEALEAFTAGAVTPKRDWPIKPRIVVSLRDNQISVVHRKPLK